MINMMSFQIGLKSHVYSRFENNLDDFIDYVEVYSYKEKQQTLSDTLVPIIKKENLEAVAEDFNTYFLGLIEPVYINPRISKQMNLTVDTNT